MLKFFISFQNGDVVAKDDEGHEYFGLEEAKEAALASARGCCRQYQGQCEKPAPRGHYCRRERTNSSDHPRQRNLAGTPVVTSRELVEIAKGFGRLGLCLLNLLLAFLGQLAVAGNFRDDLLGLSGDLVLDLTH